VEVKKSPAFEAHAVRSGDWWSVSVPGVDGAHTQARRLDQVEEAVRDALALLLDEAPDTFEITVVPDLDESQVTAIKGVSEARSELEQAKAEYLGQQRQVIDHLVNVEGLTIRDVGMILGISYQRVAQILSSPAASSSRAATA
jgi:predicted RNase H-like HicB family nuclease